MQRWVSYLKLNGNLKRKVVYGDDFDCVTENGLTRYIYYLDGGVIVVGKDGKFIPYLSFSDNLGSILSIVNDNGTKVFSADYDVWGKQTVLSDNLGMIRGYCGHEMLSEFDLINMNGRIYDPVLGRFLSPDNYVQESENSQNFNRYSYCLNNPLKYTDSSGEFWNLVLGTAMAGFFNWMANGFQVNANGIGYFASGALAGAISEGIASGIDVSMAGGNFWKGYVGLAKGVSSTGFISGAVSGATSGFAGNIVCSMCNSFIDRQNLGDGILSSLKSVTFSALSDGIIGGIFGGFDALNRGTNFLTGTTELDFKGAYSCKETDTGGLLDRLKAKGKGLCKYVGTFEDQNVFESSLLGNYSSQGGYSGVTIPNHGICVGKGVFTGGSVNGRAMIQHEYGHVLQYRMVGVKKYYTVIGKESLMNCAKIGPHKKVPHDIFWTETWANYLAKQHFGAKWYGTNILTKQMRLRYFPAQNISKKLMFEKFGI